MKAGLFGLVCLLGCATVLAQPDALQGFPSVSAEHARLEQRRAQLMQELDAQDAACEKVFAVNDCTAKVQVRRRVELSDLRRQEAVLHDSERLQRSQEELRRNEAKAQERAQADAERDPAANSEAQRQAALLEKQQQHARQASEPTPRTPVSSGPDPKELAEKKAEYLRKQEAAIQRRKDLAKRLEEQGSKTVLPLPPAP